MVASRGIRRGRCWKRSAGGIGSGGIAGRRWTARTGERDECADVEPWAFHLTGFDPFARFDRLWRIDRGKHGREARVEELLELLGRTLREPLGCVAGDDVPVSIDQAGHDGFAARVNRGAATRGRCVSRDRDDLAIADNDRPTLDDYPGAVEDPAIRDCEILRIHA